jgi:hypothetical protein
VIYLWRHGDTSAIDRIVERAGLTGVKLYETPLMPSGPPLITAKPLPTLAAIAVTDVTTLGI